MPIRQSKRPTLYCAERRAEQQWTESSIAPTDIEPNPTVDCTHRPGFDGPSDVGWSAVVR